MSGQNSENVDIIVAVLKNMKTRERNSCIKQIKTIINSSGLNVISADNLNDAAAKIVAEVKRD